MNKKKLLLNSGVLLLLNILLLSKSLNSQVTGVLFSPISNKPVQYATIEANNLSQKIRFTISDSLGKFTIDTVAIKSISISAVGFHTKTLSIQEAETMGFRISMIPDDKVLNNVEVIARRPLVYGDVSGIRYDVWKDSTMVGKNAAQAFAKLPFISIDASENLSYKNREKFIVFINGSKLGIITEDPSNALKSLTSEMIQTLELIFDPPLEYKLKGYTALINIQTKPGYYKGILGSVSGSGSTIGELSSSANFSFQSGNSYFQIAHSNRSNNYKKKFISHLLNYQNLNTTEQTNDLSYNSFYQNSSITFDNKLSLPSRFGLFASWSTDNYTEDGSAQIINKLATGQFEKTLSNDIIGNKQQLNVGGDYEHIYGKSRSKISLLLNFKSEKNDIISKSSERPLIRNKLFQAPDELSVQIANTATLKKGINLESVLRYINRHVKSINSIDTAVNGSWTYKEQGLEKFNFNILTLSNSIGFRTKKISIKFLLGIDYANYLVEAASGLLDYSQTNLLPGGSIRFLLKKNHYLNFKVKSNVYRPSYLSLASNIPVYDPLIISYGNKNLRNSKEYSILSEYSFYTKNDKAYLYTGIDYIFSNSLFNSFSFLDTLLNKQIITYRQSKYQDFRFFLGGELTVSKKISVDGYSAAGFINLGDNFKSSPFFEVSGSIVYQIKKGWGTQLSGRYVSRFFTSTGFRTGFGDYSLNTFWLFLNNKLRANFIISNLFKEQFYQTEKVENPNFIIEKRVGSPYQNFKLEIFYRFGKLKTFQLNTNKLSNSDIKKID